MKFYEVSQRINATPDDVWQVLCDGPGFVNWDSGIVRFEGEVALGNKVKLFSEVSSDRAFPLKVDIMDRPTKLVFTGGMPLGLFKGVRTYTLSPDGDGTKFHMREEFSGPLLNMIWKSMPDLQPSFEKFANGLKAKVENG